MQELSPGTLEVSAAGLNISDWLKVLSVSFLCEIWQQRFATRTLVWQTSPGDAGEAKTGLNKN